MPSNASHLVDFTIGRFKFVPCRQRIRIKIEGHVHEIPQTTLLSAWDSGRRGSSCWMRKTVTLDTGDFNETTRKHLQRHRSHTFPWRIGDQPTLVTDLGGNKIHPSPLATIGELVPRKHRSGRVPVPVFYLCYSARARPEGPERILQGRTVLPG